MQRTRPDNGHMATTAPRPNRKGPASEAIVYEGSESLEVRGESRHQDLLHAIAGGRSAGWGEPPIEVVATLVPEPLNPYDQHAVAVFVGDDRIGYLDRDDAALYEPGISRLTQLTGRAVAVRGVLIGGFTMEDGTQANYGIRLRHDPKQFGVMSE